MGFAEVIAVWKDYGVFEFYLPFVLMFAIFYGLLSKSKIFGDPSKEKRVTNINVVVSIVAALFVMVYTPAGITLTVFFGTFFTQTMVILATILSFALILYLVLPTGAIEEMFKNPSKYAKYLIPIVVLIVLFIFISAGGLEIFGIKIGVPGVPGIPGIGLSTEDAVIVFLIVIFVLVVWFITRGEGEKKIVSYKTVPVYER